MTKTTLHPIFLGLVLSFFFVSKAQACETTRLTITGSLCSTAALADLSRIPDMSAAPSYSEVENQAQFSTSLAVFDSLGTQHTLHVYFYHTWPRNWTARIVVDGADIIDGSSERPEAVGEDIGLIFDVYGKRQNIATPDATLTIPWQGGASEGSISLVYTLNENTNASSISAVAQDGSAGACSPRSRLDYDGDSIDDIAVWRPSLGLWAILKSSVDNSEYIWKQWGLPGDYPLTGDYTGDGKADLVVWRPTNGTWYICKSETDFDCSFGEAMQWGLPEDKPITADFDSDGILDFIVWRPSYGLFLGKSTKTGEMLLRQWGLPGDIPLGVGTN